MTHAERQRKYAANRPPEWSSWKAMRARCEVPSHECYSYYGGRGIVVCARWRGVGGFLSFLSDMGPMPFGGSIHRRDSDGLYCKENCEWVDRGENSAGSRGVLVSHKMEEEVPF